MVLLRETLANLRSHTYKTTLVVILMVASFVGLVVAETMSASQHIGDRDRLIAAGDIVFVVAPPPPGSGPSLPTQICDQLDDLPQIVASGGIVRVGFRELSKAPGTPLYVAGGTGSIARVLDPTVESSSGALISRTAARQIGIVQGETENVDGHTVVLRPFDPEVRFSNGETLVLIPYSGPLVDECWFETTPGGWSAATEVGLAAFATINRSVGRLRSDDLTTVSPASDFERRSSRLLWLPVGGTIGIFLGVLMMLSRPEIALYRSMGVTRTGVVVVSALGYFLIALWSLVIGVLTAGLVLDDLGPGGAALLVGVRSGIAGFLVAVFCLAAAALFAQRGSISQMLKLRSA